MNRPGDTVSGMMNGHQILAGYTIRDDPGAEIVLKIHGRRYRCNHTQYLNDRNIINET
jgi:hypothetical protein